MERKGRIFGGLLILATIICGCTYHEKADEVEIRINFTGVEAACRSGDPDEEKISDISLMIFDDNGSAEECFWIEDASAGCWARLVTGRKYIFCACANFGYQVRADEIEELSGLQYHLAYPDEFSRGIPMYAYQEVTIDKGCRDIFVNLERLMAKISLRMDRSRLSDGVGMFVRSVRIGNCPKSVAVFKESAVSGEDGCFPAGFSRYGLETDGLNRTTGSGLSEYVSLYMLENMQGDFGGDIAEDSGKVFGPDDYRRMTCSYIEMELDYMSDAFYSGRKGLIYRFYLGEDRNSLNVERNSHYRITVTPEDDGLSEDGWRVDKSGLQTYGPVHFKAYPADYIVGDIGDRIHIWCEFSPENTPFDVGISYMEDDRKEGIYDYVIDGDGHGATLTLTGPGRGLIYMEAGEPINDAALFIIEVNQP